MIPNSLFTVPIWDDEYPNFASVKDDLIVNLKNYLTKYPHEVRSNVNGKHSRTLLHEESEFKMFFDYITLKANLAAASIGLRGELEIMESWVNINDTPGAFNLQHIHGGVISGVFYVQVPKNSGALFLSNPAPVHLWEGFNMNPERSHFASETIEVNPVEGTFLLWPSYLPHAVGPNTANIERISIAFNTKIKG